MNSEHIPPPNPVTPALVTLQSHSTLRTVRLGRVRPAARPQVVHLARYFRKTEAPQPPSVDYSEKAMDSLSRVYLNDRYGCCVIASAYHEIGLWTGNETGTVSTAADKEILAAYRGICGPGDNGCIITNVLNYMRAYGLVANGVRHKIDDYCAVDWTDPELVKAAIRTFGTIKIGVNLPEAWLYSTTWDVTNTSIVGGHDIPAVGYNEQGVKVCSWGQLYTITWPAFTAPTWVEEAYALLAPDWYSKDQVAANGFNVAELKEALDNIRAYNVPELAHLDPWENASTYIA